MDALTAAAASGLRARMESLEMLANNLANAATGGYKADREFYSLYLAPEAADSSSADPTVMPLIERPWIDLSQGLLRSTDNPLDLALSGKGFFAVDGPSGPLYTRNGNFRLSTAGKLVTGENYPVRFEGTANVVIEPAKPVDVSPDGSVLQEGQMLGHIEIVDVPDTAALSKMGNSYFQYNDPKQKPVAASGVEVHQGRLESSNVGSAEAAVRLVGVMRQFEMLQKAIALGADMNRRAIEEVARVNP